MFNKLRRDAAIEAAKITFSLLGVGATLADFSRMNYIIMLPGAAILTAIWYIIYRQCA